MKSLFSAICLSVVISFLGSCKKDTHEEIKTFDYEKAAGIWVPYEIIQPGGTIDRGEFTANSFFGSYDESVQLKKDQTFIPIIWYNKDNFFLDTAKTSSYEYLPGNKLIFNGDYSSGDLTFEYELIKFEGDDLWLKNYATIKFKRQP
jgi:hypothetical protein